jgi:hypothetical protein
VRNRHRARSAMLALGPPNDTAVSSKLFPVAATRSSATNAPSSHRIQLMRATALDSGCSDDEVAWDGETTVPFPCLKLPRPIRGSSCPQSLGRFHSRDDAPPQCLTLICRVKEVTVRPRGLPARSVAWDQPLHDTGQQPVNDGPTCPQKGTCATTARCGWAAHVSKKKTRAGTSVGDRSVQRIYSKYLASFR